MAFFVFSTDSNELSTTKGNSGILLILCPLAKTKGTTALAAKAAATACLF